MRMIVGLGNPGSRYAGSRHNVGFAVIDEFARRWHLSLDTAQNGVRMAEGAIAGEVITVVQPQRYMNLSGTALADLDRAPTARDLIVVHDDLDLEPGCVRVKRGGGTAGHHGLDSLVEQFGHEFTRVRIGVGHPPPGGDVVAYVLTPFDSEERDMISAAVHRAADAVETIVRRGEEAAMNCFNTRRTTGAALVAAPMGRK